MLDPACGNGQFLALHRNSAGVEQDVHAVKTATERAPWAMIHEGDFFLWAGGTVERFDAAAGNPPFIRYQRFTGSVRKAALSLCERLGASFSSLTSSWAPFLVAAASLLRPGGRFAFVVPAEIGHAPYAVPLLEYLTGHFDHVQIVPVQEKIFPDLSEDCWLLYAEGFGGSTNRLRLSPVRTFVARTNPPSHGFDVTLAEWRFWNRRLRPFLMAKAAREIYKGVVDAKDTVRLGQIAKVGIGYVTGANDFFHLRPSTASEFGIPDHYLHPSVRNGRVLAGSSVTMTTVRRWLLDDEPILLLRLHEDDDLPTPVVRYLDIGEAAEAREAYKCRMRDPWYVVPDVTVPDAFLSYMSGSGVSLVANQASCVCTNSVHAIHLTGGMALGTLQRRWKDLVVRLSCEVEGHPLGGGMLKVEPREAARIVLPHREASPREDRAIFAGIEEMRRWRHYA